jgi:hypothetical protein
MTELCLFENRVYQGEYKSSVREFWDEKTKNQLHATCSVSFANKILILGVGKMLTIRNLTYKIIAEEESKDGIWTTYYLTRHERRD